MARGSKKRRRLTNSKRNSKHNSKRNKKMKSRRLRIRGGWGGLNFATAGANASNSPSIYEQFRNDKKQQMVGGWSDIIAN